MEGGTKVMGMHLFTGSARRRYLTLTGVGACAAVAAIAIAASPASAQGFTSAVALNPDDTLGLDVGSGDIVVDSAAPVWNIVDQGGGTWGGVQGESYEFQVPGTTFCLADTSQSGQAALARCGNNGTSWVNTDTTGQGEYLYERYGLNHGWQVVLAVPSPPFDGATVAVTTAGNVLDGSWSGFWGYPG